MPMRLLTIIACLFCLLAAIIAFALARWLAASILVAAAIILGVAWELATSSDT